MSLTPKNWKSFQHYKERSPIWIKLHRGLLDDVQFQRLPIASRALAPMLWLYAAEYADGVISEAWSDIAFRLRMTLDEFTCALEPLIAKGFFISDECAIDPLATRQQDACPEKRREETETEKNSRRKAPVRAPKQIDLEEAIAASPSPFDEFWKAYPRRDGPNPRKPAEQRFDALVKTGLDAAFLVAEVKRFAVLDDTRKAAGTRFIPQAVTWLNQQRWSDHAAETAVASLDVPAVSIEIAVAQFARFRRWPRSAGPEPGLTGCKASVELLAAHGLRPDGGKLALAPMALPDEPLEAAE